MASSKPRSGASTPNLLPCSHITVHHDRRVTAKITSQLQNLKLGVKNLSLLSWIDRHIGQTMLMNFMPSPTQPGVVAQAVGGAEWAYSIPFHADFTPWWIFYTSNSLVAALHPCHSPFFFSRSDFSNEKIPEKMHFWPVTSLMALYQGTHFKDGN